MPSLKLCRKSFGGISAHRLVGEAGPRRSASSASFSESFLLVRQKQQLSCTTCGVAGGTIAASLYLGLSFASATLKYPCSKYLSCERIRAPPQIRIARSSQVPTIGPLSR